MLTVDALKEYGANTEEGLARCVNMEALYIKLVNSAANDAGYERLENAIQAGDLDEAFEAAHGLKGVLANLALTPVLEPVEEVTEYLRSRADIDYAPYIEEIKAKRDALKAICD